MSVYLRVHVRAHIQHSNEGEYSLNYVLDRQNFMIYIILKINWINLCLPQTQKLTCCIAKG